MADGETALQYVIHSGLDYTVDLPPKINKKINNPENVKCCINFVNNFV